MAELGYGAVLALSGVGWGVARLTKHCTRMAGPGVYQSRYGLLAWRKAGRVLRYPPSGKCGVIWLGGE